MFNSYSTNFDLNDEQIVVMNKLVAIFRLIWGSYNPLAIMDRSTPMFTREVIDSGILLLAIDCIRQEAVRGIRYILMGNGITILWEYLQDKSANKPMEAWISASPNSPKEVVDRISNILQSTGVLREKNQ
jgi:hypothetical protein